MAYFRYLVNDVDESVNFYSDLGFKVKEKHGPAMAIVTKDDMTLWLAGPPSSAARAMPDGAKPEPGGWNRFVLPVDDIESKVAELKKRGTKFRNDIVSGPGGKQILCEDPSGNVVEIFEPAH